MFVNGDAVEMVHVPAAHTNGDSFVVFRRTDVIAVGDVYTPDRYPKLDLEHGGSLDGLLAGINSLLQRTIPQFNQEGGTLVVPGHGRLSDEGDVAEYRDMVTIVRDRIKNMISKKMTLAQVKAARPTLEYDVLYGAPEGEIFVEQIYRSLTKPAKPKDASGAGE
jgi:glyoxylase-like metal-dependent hydrolase (beta-lactamase superfamily II)